MGDSRAKFRGNYFFFAPVMQGKLLGFNIKILTPGRYSIVNGKVKSMVLTFILSPVDGSIAGLKKTEKSQSPPFPVGGEAMVTNDWCITIKNA